MYYITEEESEKLVENLESLGFSLTLWEELNVRQQYEDLKFGVSEASLLVNQNSKLTTAFEQLR